MTRIRATDYPSLSRGHRERNHLCYVQDRLSKLSNQKENFKKVGPHSIREIVYRMKLYRSSILGGLFQIKIMIQSAQEI